MERPDEAIAETWNRSFSGSAERHVVDYLEHVEAVRNELTAKLKELEAIHAECPREVSGDEIDDTVEVWLWNPVTGINGWNPLGDLTPDARYIVRPRKTQTAEQKFRDALADEGLSDQSMERLIAAARKAGLLREES